MSLKDTTLTNSSLVELGTNTRANTIANMRANTRVNMKGVDYGKLNLIKIDHQYIATGTLFSL